MDVLQVLVQAGGWLVQQPAIQGVAVAAVTEAVKRAPAGPSAGTGVRLVAAVLALSASVAAGVASGSVEALDAQQVGQQAIEALSAFLAAVGAWQLARKQQA